MAKWLEKRAAEVAEKVREGEYDNGDYWVHYLCDEEAQSAIASLAREYAAECVEEASEMTDDEPYAHGRTAKGRILALAERIRKGEGDE
jgi:hypothetical protein